MKSLKSAVMLAVVAAGASAAETTRLPKPDLTTLEPIVAAQLSELQELAETVVYNNLASRLDKIKTWGEMGRVYHAYELLDAADICYERAEALDPETRDWPYYRGHVASALGDLEGAAAGFTRALELGPDDVATLVYLADVENAQGRRQQARMLLERAVRLPSSEPVVWARLGELAVAEERYAEAVPLLSAVLEAVPQATRLHHPLGMAYRGLNDLERAREHLGRRGEVGLAPNDPLMDRLATVQVGERVHLLRGRTAFKAGSFADAAAEFRQAVDARPESVRSRVNLSAALAGMGDAEGARRELERAVELEPENPTARFNLGSLLASAGEHRLAVVHFAAASLARPEDDEAWLGEAKSWIALGDFARATDRLAVANSTVPSSGRVAFALARLLAAAPDVTVRDGTRALDLASGVFAAQRTAEHAILVSLALRELGRCAEAREWLDDLIEQAESTDAPAVVSLLAPPRAELSDQDPCRP